MTSLIEKYRTLTKVGDDCGILYKKCNISTKFGNDYNILKDTSVRNSRNQSYLNAIASEIIQNHSLFISDLV